MIDISLSKAIILWGWKFNSNICSLIATSLQLYNPNKKLNNFLNIIIP